MAQPRTRRGVTRWPATLSVAGLVAASVVLAVRSRPELAVTYAGAARLPAPALTPARSMETIRTADGLRVQLAAAEPMVVAPVAAQFDEDGRLWVVEMPTYMPDLAATGETGPGGRVLVLTDADGDGVFESSQVFLDRLVLARAVAPCYGGALVIEPPNLLFCRDTDGDGRADERRVVLKGIGIGENPEHAGNGLIRGLDNWYHLSQDRLEFLFDGERVVTRPTPRHGQWGLAQDDFGRLYTTPNSNPLLADLYPKHYAARNPAQGGAPGIGEDICPDRTTWPAHPTPGVNRGYQENVLRPDGTLATVTGACGTLIYRAGALGEQFRGNAFICEVAGNLVKRLALGERSGLPRAENTYKDTEFLRSTEERFRPVNLTLGPDGALYVLDMYRGLIQHKTYVTPYLRRQIVERGLERPLILGRIYRVSGDPARLRRAAELSSASAPELVRLLNDPDGWWRDTAQRLLVERRAAAVAQQVREIAERAPAPEARAAALWTLEGIGALTHADAARALADPSPDVRASVVRLAEAFMEDPVILTAVQTLIDDEDYRVRMQAAATLGTVRGDAGDLALAAVLRKHGGDRYIRGAAIGGLAGREVRMLGALLAESSWPRSAGDGAVAADLTDCALRSSDEERADLADLIGQLASSGDERAGPLLARVRRMQRIESPEPRPLKLSREPSSWLAAAEGKSPSSLAGDLLESAVYLDWPDRPPVKRKFVVQALTTAEQARFNQGRGLYAACQACHQQDGTGSVGMAPPLAGSSLVQGPAERLAKVVLHGMEGPYTMLEMEFEGAMVPVPLKGDAEIAAVMTYIRRAWGNTGSPVEPALVTSVRAANPGRTRPWKRAELEAEK